MNGDLWGAVAGGIFAGLFYLVFCIALIMGIRAVVRKLGKEGPSKGIPGWVWLLGSFMAAGAAGQGKSAGRGGAVGAVAADFLFLLTAVIAVILLVRAIARAVRHRESQKQDQAANRPTTDEDELPPDQPS